MRILCLGDSNTYGYDPRGYFGGRYGAEDRWVDLTAKWTGFDMVNLGSNGRTVPHNSFTVLSADVLLVMLGTNDLLQGVTAKETAVRMEKFLLPLLPCFRRILLVAPLPMKRGAWVAADALVAESIHLSEDYKLLAESLGIEFVDTCRWDIELAFDGVHFTEQGHHMFAKQLIKYL